MIIKVTYQARPFKDQTLSVSGELFWRRESFPGRCLSRDVYSVSRTPVSGVFDEMFYKNMCVNHTTLLI